MKKIITLATSNPHKTQKLTWIVGPHFDSVQKLTTKLDVEEDRSTFEGNAQIKAEMVSKIYHTYAVATDGGAVIPALGNKWNALLTKRFIGKQNVTDWDRIEALLTIMQGLKGDERKVQWREALAITNPSGKVIFSTEVEGDTGLIQESYNKTQYRKGIWLCTLTSYPQFGNKNFFELTEDETKDGEISWWRIKDLTTKFLRTLEPIPTP